MNDLQEKQTAQQETEAPTTQKVPPRYNLYAQMNVSLKSVDRFILVVGILLVASILFAIR